MKKLIAYVALLLFLLGIQLNQAKATTYNWVGTTLTAGKADWANNNNWRTGTLFLSTPPVPPTVNDDVNIGVLASVTITNPPTVVTTGTCASITFGATIPALLSNTMTLTVNGTLTTVAIVQSPTILSDYSVVVTGTGTLNATSLQISNNSILATVLKPFTSLKFISSLTNFHISGNVVVNSTAMSLLGIGLGNVNGYFSLQGGTTTIDGSISTVSTFIPILSSTVVYGTPKFYVEPPSSTTANLKLTAALPIDAGSSANSIDFFAGSGTCTVEYARSTSQTVYTDLSTNTFLDTSPSVYQNIKFTGTGQKNIQASNLTIAGDWASSGGKVDATSNNPTVIFQGAGQNLSDTTSDSGNGVVFKNVNFQASGTKLISLGNFLVSSDGTLTMATTSTPTTSTVLNANGLLTLKSDAGSTATVAKIPNGCSITGNVNVQRYITGGSGYRGYRLISPPVNISTNTSGGGNLGLAYISTSQTIGSTTFNGALTGGPGTGFFVPNGNPSLYLYDESRTTDNTSFVAGKNVGIYSITGSTVTTTSGKPAVQVPNVSIPVGNSLLFFFIGDNSSTVTAGASRTPENTTVTATGYLNQGNVPVTFWNTGSTSIPYHTGTGGVLPGYNQVGNPYASTIDLTVFHTDNPAISSILWEMNEPGQKYISYDSVTPFHTSDPKASKYIVSGQGFIIQATAINQTVTFKEGEKISYPAITKSTTPALLMSTKGNIAAISKSFNQAVDNSATPEAGLHLQIIKDSLVNAACGIYFNKKYDDNFQIGGDALDLDGASPKVYMSSYSADGIRTSINELSDYAGKGKKIKLFVKATSSGMYNLSLLDITNIDTINYRIYLIDHLKNDSLDIAKYKTYAFNLTTTDTTTFGANRFVLSIQPTSTSKYLLVTFTAQKASNGVLVTWRTYNEGNNYAFTLEKLSADGTTYSSAYQTQSNGGTIYTYTDKTPVNGNNTYRLKQVDLLGNITYSNPVSVNYDNTGSQNMFSLYPNPTAETLNVNVTYSQTNAAATSSYDLKIYDATGAVIMQKTAASTCWSENVSQFKPGLYIVELKNANGYSLGQAKFLKE